MKGSLVLKKYPEKIIDIEKAEVDWEKTTAWGWGGYYARIFLNVKGREPLGLVAKEDFEMTRERLAGKLKEVKGPDGRIMNTLVYKPENMYKSTVGDKPDLMVYFDDLYWRSAGTVGHNTMYLSENDTGPDDSVHSLDGTFILHDPQLKFRGKIKDFTIYDVAPTILDRLGVPIPQDMQGKPLSEDNIGDTRQ